jgi:hypothetical protein
LRQHTLPVTKCASQRSSHASSTEHFTRIRLRACWPFAMPGNAARYRSCLWFQSKLENNYMKPQGSKAVH